MKTYVPCSTKQLNMCLTLCMFLRPFILSSAFTSACASLNWIHGESLSTCTTKLWTRGVIFLKVLRSQLFFPPASTSHATRPQSLQQMQYVLKFMAIGWRSASGFSLVFIYHCILNPEAPKYHKQREFFRHFQLEQKQLVFYICSPMLTQTNSDLGQYLVIPIPVLQKSPYS